MERHLTVAEQRTVVNDLVARSDDAFLNFLLHLGQSRHGRLVAVSDGAVLGIVVAAVGPDVDQGHVTGVGQNLGAQSTAVNRIAVSVLAQSGNGVGHFDQLIPSGGGVVIAGRGQQVGVAVQGKGLGDPSRGILMAVDIRAGHGAGVEVCQSLGAHVFIQRQQTAHFVVGSHPLVGDLRHVGSVLRRDPGQQGGVHGVIVALGDFHGDPRILFHESVQHGLESIGGRFFGSAPAKELQSNGFFFFLDGFRLGSFRRLDGFGGFGFLSFGAAGSHGQNHGQCQYDGENLFHCFASFLFFSQQTRKCRIVKQNRFILSFNFVSFSFRNRKSRGIVFARLYLLLV